MITYRSTRQPNEYNDAYFDPTMYRNGTCVFINFPLFIYVHPLSPHGQDAIAVSLLHALITLFMERQELVAIWFCICLIPYSEYRVLRMISLHLFPLEV